MAILVLKIDPNHQNSDQNSDQVRAETPAYLSAKILMDYLLQEPIYSHLKFVGRIAPTLKTKIPFSLASYIWWCWFQEVRTEFFSSKLLRFSKQVLCANI